MYASRALTSTEQKYSQIEKEALAMAWACEKFHRYLFGIETPFPVEMDHKPLLAIMNTQNMVECPPHLMRLKLRMLRCCFTVEYVPGKKLVVADALSRAPVPTDESQQETLLSELLEDHISVITALFLASDLQLRRIREETQKGVQLAALLTIL